MPTIKAYGSNRGSANTERARHGFDHSFYSCTRGYTSNMEFELLPTTGATHWFADLAVDGVRVDGEGSLTYTIPERLLGMISPGSVVWVRTRQRWAPAVVITVHQRRPDFSTKPIQALTEPAFVLSESRIETALWLARETASSLYAAFAPFLPPGLTRPPEEYLRLLNPDPAVVELTTAQQKLVRLLIERGEIRLTVAQGTLKTKLTTVVPKLEELGVIERFIRSVSAPEPAVRGTRYVRLLDDQVSPDLDRAPKQRAVVELLQRRARLAPAGARVEEPLARLLERSGASVAAVAGLVQKGIVQEVFYPSGLEPVDESRIDPAPVLTNSQSVAWGLLEQALIERDGAPFLLHGVTGSGKTEIYLRATAWCLRRKRAVLLLVPEITLASQIVRRLRARFPGQVSVLHSGLSHSERMQSWKAIDSGTTPIVVGARSALFAPVHNAGLIVIDEEHEGAYKQDSEPRYHARALAEKLGTQHGAVVVLGSATPAVETAWRAESGDIDELSLPDRVGPALSDSGSSQAGRPLELPPVEVVDLRLELHRGHTGLFSEPMVRMVQRTLDAREQAILLLNRRGLATVVLCRSCGQSLMCPLCDIPLVFHGDLGVLLCHRCDYREAPRDRCGACGGGLNYFGAGTQRVEAEVRRLFPSARVLRWDQDVIRRTHGHDALLQQVERHEVDIIAGTQMIAKGLDLPLVTGIGVINADTMLHLPDFRSGERTFQLLTQVAGRAGRRGPGSEVIVQSYTPDHYAIVAAAKHDYDQFFAEEIDFRRIHRYPPFTRLVRYVVKDGSEERCAERADAVARVLVRHARSRGVEMDLLGPAPAFAARVRGMYQWQIVLRTEHLEPLLDELPRPAGWVVDVDPLGML